MTDRSVSPTASSLGSDISIPSTAIARRYPCKSCDKDFSTSGQLSRHNRIHKGIKKFLCDVPGCTRSFFRADNREQHSKSHKRRLQKQVLRESEAIACRVLSGCGGGLKSLPPHQSVQLSPPRTPICSLVESNQNQKQPNQYEHDSKSYFFPVLPVQLATPPVGRYEPDRYPLATPLPQYIHEQSDMIRKTSIQFLCD
ncbi:hypothetical protein BDR26DRAFT_851179 [Obelidium mucronatum]|nr:hypothetical protein BDR26DRAFT_851179 [Obelidium mucronatum]